MGVPGVESFSVVFVRPCGRVGLTSGIHIRVEVLCALPLNVGAQFAVLGLVAGKGIFELLALAVGLDVDTLFDATHGDGLCLVFASGLGQDEGAFLRSEVLSP